MKKLSKKTKDRLLLIFLIFVLILLIVVLLITSLLSLNPPSFIAVLNLDANPIYVNDTKLEVYDTYNSRSYLNTRFTVKDAAMQDLTAFYLPSITLPELLLYVNSRNEICFFSADVTAFYYGGDNSQLNDFEIISDKPTNTINFNMSSDQHIYIYPGKYNESNLPQLLANKKVIGIYPILCADLNNSGKQIETVNFYKSFDSVSQREYYLQNIVPLQEELN